jgi:hypothetical protein
LRLSFEGKPENLARNVKFMPCLNSTRDGSLANADIVLNHGIIDFSNYYAKMPRIHSIGYGK